MAKPCMMLLLVYAAAALKMSRETPDGFEINNYGFAVPKDGNYQAPHEVVASLLPGSPALAAAFNPANYGSYGTSILKESAQVEKPKLAGDGKDADHKINKKGEKIWAIGDKDWIQPQHSPDFEDEDDPVEQKSRFGDIFAAFVNNLHPVDSHHISSGYGINKHNGDLGQGHGNNKGFNPALSPGNAVLQGREGEHGHYYIPLNPPAGEGYEGTNIMANGRKYIDEQRAAAAAKKAQDAATDAAAAAQDAAVQAAAAAQDAVNKATGTDAAAAGQDAVNKAMGTDAATQLAAAGQDAVNKATAAVEGLHFR